MAAQQKSRPSAFYQIPSKKPAETMVHQRIIQKEPAPQINILKRRMPQIDEKQVADSIVKGDYDLEMEAVSLPVIRGAGVLQDIIHDKLALKREDVRRNIEKKEGQMARVKKLVFEKKSVKDTMAYLKGLGVQIRESEEIKQGDIIQQPKGVILGFKNVPSKIPRFRPQFRPDGALLTLKSNSTLQIQEVPVLANSTNKEQKETYQSISKILLGSTEILENSGDISENMQRMDISEEQAFDPILQKLRNKVSERYDDITIGEALSNIRMPVVTFKKNPQEMFFFYEAMAKNLISQINSKTVKKSQATIDNLTHEFHTICLMNALFGNPNIHLVQLHMDFKGGIKNYEKAKEMFGGSFNDDSSLANEKKRKNALIEVLRFVCLQTFKVAQGEDPHKTALLYLLNGDMRSAVAVLNGAQKFQMAQYVMNCFSSELTKKAMETLFADRSSNIYSKFTDSAQNLVKFMMGSLLDNMDQNINWMQALLYWLLVKSNPADTLENAIQGFSATVFYRYYANQQGQREPLMWILIKLFGVNQPDVLLKQLLPFENIQLYPSQTATSHLCYYRLQFIIVLCLYNFLIHVKLNRHFYDKKYSTLSVTHERVTHFATLYSNQLLQSGDWKQALLIASFIPETFAKHRKHLTFNILMKKAYLFGQPQEETNDNDVEMIEAAKAQSASQKIQEWTLKTLKIPAVMLFIARAIFNQSIGRFDLANVDWEKSQNLNMAHSLFFNKIVPLYFTNVANNLRVKSKKIDFPVEASCISINDSLTANNHHLIYGWKSQGALLKHFINLYNLKQIPLENQSKLVAKEVYLINPDINLSLAVVHRFVWEQLLQWDKELKLKNAMEIEKQGRAINLEVMEEIVAAYPDSPQLSRVFEEFAVKVHTWAYCQRASKAGSFMPRSQLQFAH